MKNILAEWFGATGRGSFPDGLIFPFAFNDEKIGLLAAAAQKMFTTALGIAAC